MWGKLLIKNMQFWKKVEVALWLLFSFCSDHLRVVARYGVMFICEQKIAATYFSGPWLSYRPGALYVVRYMYSLKLC
jgi:hypothetical protein